MQYQSSISPLSIHGYNNNIILDLRFHTLKIINYFNLIFSFEKIKEKIILSIRHDLESLFTHISTLKLEIKNIDNSSAIIAYPKAEKDLKRFKKIYNILEKFKFCENQFIAEASENILTELYAIEYTIRLAAFIGKNKIDSDKELINNASIISINSLHSSNVPTSI